MIKSRWSSWLATLMMVPQWLRGASPLKSDEELQLFPVAARPVEEGRWEVVLHGWVYEREQGSIWRKLVTFGGSEAIELLGVSEEAAHDPRFAERFSWFLVDSERNKRIIAHVGDQRLVSHSSKPNGHMTFPPASVTGQPGDWLTVSVESSHAVHAQLRGQFQLVAETGVTVISDIDDTVKISEVLDRKALVRNIFANDYKTTEGMPAFYRTLAEKGVYFHYLSASPWQLYASLQSFLDMHYPSGSISLRHFRLGDQSFWDFFHSSMGYKLDTLRQRIEAFPGHRFVLIGDSGERDPEVYAQIQSEFPRQVERIFIRKVPDSDLSEARLTRVFGGMPDYVWQVFDDPQTLDTGFID